MRSIAKYSEIKDIPPLSEREWNYYFNVGDRVKIIPEMTRNWIYSDSSFFESIDEDMKNGIGVVINCWSDLHCSYGSSYVCDVDFDGKQIRLLSMFFYTSKKF